MVDKTNKRKKGSITEQDTANLLQRYSPKTILALLQEVGQVPEVKIDWNALVKNTKTGISNAREYQMLWRHLAYGVATPDQLEDNAEPLDDDSDLEYEMEAFPAVSSEASAEASACVKVMIASSSLNDPNVPKGSIIEAPLPMNIPSAQSSGAPSDNPSLANSKEGGTNIIVPIPMRKQNFPAAVCPEELDTNAVPSSKKNSSRKRKNWSESEDMQLIAAVKKWGEANWTNLKEDFNGERTEKQLWQRWATIKNRQGDWKVGTEGQLSETQLATRRAVSIALNMPIGSNLKGASSVRNTTMNTAVSGMPSSAAEIPSSAPEIPSTGNHPQHRSPLSSSQQSHQLGAAKPSKSQVVPKVTSAAPTPGPDSMVKAAAIAAGARLATPSDTASLLSAAQSKNNVHIIPVRGSLIKSTAGGNMSQLPSNVHLIHRATLVAPAPNAARPGETHQTQTDSAKTAGAIVLPSPAVTAPGPYSSSGTKTPPIGQSTKLVKTGEDNATPRSENVNRETVPINQIHGRAEFSNNPPEAEVCADKKSASGNV